MLNKLNITPTFGSLEIYLIHQHFIENRTRSKRTEILDILDHAWFLLTGIIRLLA